MKQLEFSFVATLLVLPSFFQLIISLLLLLSSAYIVRFHTPSHGTDARSKQKLIMNAYAFSIAPFPFLPPPPFHLYLFLRLLSWSTTSCCILVELLSIHSVERIACIFCYVLFLHKFDLQDLYKYFEWSSKLLLCTVQEQVPGTQVLVPGTYLVPGTCTR